MVDTLAPNATVSADQLGAARVALAQNHTIENVLGPDGDVNLTKLAKLHNDNPGMLSGPMQEIAQFASDHPEVTRLPGDAERFNPSGVLKDITSINPLQRPLGSLAQLGGGFFARRALTRGAASVDVPTTGLAGEFDPLPMNTLHTPGEVGPAPPRQQPLALAPGRGQTLDLDLQQPPGSVYEPHQPQLATGNPEPKRKVKNLADLLK